MHQLHCDELTCIVLLAGWTEGGAPPKRAAVDAETGAGEAEPPSSRPQNGLPGELGQNQGYGAPGQFAPPPGLCRKRTRLKERRALHSPSI